MFVSLKLKAKYLRGSKQRILYILLLLMLFVNSFSQKFDEYFIDSTDNALDISGFLNSPVGFMPVPIIITEPALGFGGGMSAVYFHNKKNFMNSIDGKGVLPPVMSIAAGAYTSSDSWMLLGGHQGSYKKDRFRYTGGIGYMNFNLKFYGAGILVEEREYHFNMKGIAVFQEFSFRPKKDLPLFTGLNYIYFGSNVAFKTGLEIPELEVLSQYVQIGGVNILMMYDIRDNSFTPSKGLLTATEFGKFAKWLGSDRDFMNFSHRTYAYTPFFDEKLVGGYRIYIQAKWDDVPFYALPFVQLRGIQALRYQNNYVGVGETEWRWNVFRRWSVVGFVGVGFTSEKLKEFRFKYGKAAYGGGFRYFIAKDYGIHGGIDIARGPEVWAWYITVGSNWVR